MLRLCVTAVLVVGALSGCGSDGPGGPGGVEDRGDTVALVVGGDELPPSDVEEFTSFDAEQLADTCGEAPRLPSQDICALPFIQSPPGSPVDVLRVTLPEGDAFVALSRDDACEADPTACPEPVELTTQEVAEIVALLDLEVTGPPVTPGSPLTPDDEPPPLPTDESGTEPSQPLPTDGAS